MRWPALLLLAAWLAAAEWRPAAWRGLPSFSSRHGGWEATVCPAWGRLVSLRAPDGSELLRVPEQPLAALRGGPAGGHMVWLGPQARWGWPPPAHWEYSPGEVAVAGGELTLRMPPGDARHPGIDRRYAWAADGLRCTAIWRGPGRWYALQVFQVRGDADVRLRLQPTPALPHGFAVVDGDRHAVDRALPQPCLVAAEGDEVCVLRGTPFQKILLPYQPIRVRVGAASLQLERIAADGVDAEDGKPTMIFAGSQWDMIEIEQASTYRDAEAMPAEAVVVLRVGG